MQRSSSFRAVYFLEKMATPKEILLNFYNGRSWYLPSHPFLSSISNVQNIRMLSGYLWRTDKPSECAALSFRLITRTTKEIAFC